VFRGVCDAPADDGAVGGCAQVVGTPPPQAIGKVQTATGPVTVMGASGVVAHKVGDRVYRHDTIETGADGAVGITFTDGTAFNLSFAHCGAWANDHCARSIYGIWHHL